MTVSYCEAKRVWARYQKEGNAGLIYFGTRLASAAAQEVIVPRQSSGPLSPALLRFGPTLAAVHLREEGLVLSPRDAAPLPGGPAALGARGRTRRKASPARPPSTG